MSIINIILEIGIAIISLGTWLFDKNSDKEESNFNEFSSIKIEKFTRNSKIKGILYIVFIVLNYIVLASFSIFIDDNIFFFDKETIEIMMILIIVILVFATAIQVLLNSIIAFRNISFIEKKVNQNNIEGLKLITTWVWVGAVVIYVIISCIHIDEQTNLLVLYSTILICLATEADWCSFLAVYIKLRHCYVVKEINIKIKGNENLYLNVANYKKDKISISFVTKEKNCIKKITANIAEIEYIERIIDKKNSLLEGFFKE